MTARVLPTFEMVRDLLIYDQSTGILHWKVARGRAHVGDHAGFITWNGYIQITIADRHYAAHRLAWLLTFGHWPSHALDHADRNRANNRIHNLRLATPSQNGGNSRGRRVGGLKGASQGRDGKWRATITHKGRWQHIGWYDTEHEAHGAYCAVALRLFGKFARAA